MRLISIAVLTLIVVAATSKQQVAAVAAGRPAGEAVFRQRCQACHSVVVGQPNRVGPNLAGVVGRKAASARAFNYSPALKASGLTWTRANLDRYLQGPARMVPGTRMVVALTDDTQRAALLTYLTTQK